MFISRITLLFVLGLSMIGLPFASADTQADKIDINSADAWTLDALYGVGPTKAAAIVEYRELHEGFKSVDELTQVYGINKNLLDRNRDKIIVSDFVASDAIQPPRSRQVVNINTADAVTLAKKLHGVGKKKAAAIVAFREKFGGEDGPFKSIFDLARVKGIGRKIIERNRDKIVLSDPEVETAEALVPPSTEDSASSQADDGAEEKVTEETPATDDSATTPDSTNSQ